MISPKSFIRKKCYVVGYDSFNYRPIVYEANILNGFSLGRSYVVQTDYGFYDIASYLIHDTESVAESVAVELKKQIDSELEKVNGQDSVPDTI